MKPVDRVRAYYEALRGGDADDVAQHFSDDAVHYYTRREPHRGREIADHAALAVQHLNAIWRLENVVGDDEQVVIEWTMEFDHPQDPSRRMLDRGTEWFHFDADGLICEVRAYYDGRGGDLQGFDHAGRGHTVL
jgi:ketosteroid isomerase-like protein